MNIITETVNALLQIYIATLFFGAFWKRKPSKLLFALSFAVSVIGLLFGLLFLKGTVFIFIVNYLVIFVISLRYDGKILTKLLFSIIYIAIVGVIEEVICIVFSTVFSVDYATIIEGKLYIPGMLLSKVIMVFVVILLKLKKRPYLFKKYKVKYISVYLIPVSSLLLGIVYHYTFINIPSPSNGILIFFLISYSLLIVANLLVFNFIDSVYTNSVNENRLEVANQVIKNQTIQYTDLIERDKEIAKILHDNKHFYLGLISELKKGNTDSVIEKLSEACDVNEDGIEYCGDIVRTIVKIKNDEASKNGISINSDYKLSDELLIDPTDIAIVLGNALDNAIEACSKIDSDNKSINLFITIKNNYLYIQISNPVLKKVDVGHLESDKGDMAHGFGIINIRSIVNKYSGECSFMCDNSLFEATFIMKNEKAV